MNTHHIHSILSTDPYCSSSFIGVFPRDGFIKLDLDSPKWKGKKIQCVVNLDESDEPGSHWIVVNKIADTLFYFDSYGLYPINKDLLQKFKEHGKVFIWNQTTLQGMDSTACGHYCIIYSLLKARNYSFQDIISILFDNKFLSTHKRDHIIFDFINSMFPEKLSTLKTGIHDVNKFI